MVQQAILREAQVDDRSDVVRPEIQGLLISANRLLQVHIVRHACAELIPHGVIGRVLFNTQYEALTRFNVVPRDKVKNAQCHQHLRVLRLHHVRLIKDILKLAEVQLFRGLDLGNSLEVRVVLQPVVEVVLCVFFDELVGARNTQEHQ